MEKIVLWPGIKNLYRPYKKSGNLVVPINPDWYQSISKQIVKTKTNSIIFGFSYGAILAYLTARKYKCNKIILGSIAPIHIFSLQSLIKENLEHMSKELAIAQAEDIKNIKISLDKLDCPYITLAGELEPPIMKNNVNFIIPKANHYLSKNYIDGICKIID